MLAWLFCPFKSQPEWVVKQSLIDYCGFTLWYANIFVDLGVLASTIIDPHEAWSITKHHEAKASTTAPTINGIFLRSESQVDSAEVLGAVSDFSETVTMPFQPVPAQPGLTRDQHSADVAGRFMFFLTGMPEVRAWQQTGKLVPSSV